MFPFTLPNFITRTSQPAEASVTTNPSSSEPTNTTASKTSIENNDKDKQNEGNSTEKMNVPVGASSDVAKKADRKVKSASSVISTGGSQQEIAASIEGISIEKNTSETGLSLDSKKRLRSKETETLSAKTLRRSAEGSITSHKKKQKSGDKNNNSVKDNNPHQNDGSEVIKSGNVEIQRKKIRQAEEDSKRKNRRTRPVEPTMAFVQRGVREVKLPGPKVGWNKIATLYEEMSTRDKKCQDMDMSDKSDMDMSDKSDMDESDESDKEVSDKSDKKVLDKSDKEISDKGVSGMNVSDVSDMDISADETDQNQNDSDKKEISEETNENECLQKEQHQSSHESLLVKNKGQTQRIDSNTKSDQDGKNESHRLEGESETGCIGEDKNSNNSINVTEKAKARVNNENDKMGKDQIENIIIKAKTNENTADRMDQGGRCNSEDKVKSKKVTEKQSKAKGQNGNTIITTKTNESKDNNISKVSGCIGENKVKAKEAVGKQKEEKKQNKTMREQSENIMVETKTNGSNGGKMEKKVNVKQTVEKQKQKQKEEEKQNETRKEQIKSIMAGTKRNENMGGKTDKVARSISVNKVKEKETTEKQIEKKKQNETMREQNENTIIATRANENKGGNINKVSGICTNELNAKEGTKKQNETNKQNETMREQSKNTMPGTKPKENTGGKMDQVARYNSENKAKTKQTVGKQIEKKKQNKNMREHSESTMIANKTSRSKDDRVDQVNLCNSEIKAQTKDATEKQNEEEKEKEEKKLTKSGNEPKNSEHREDNLEEEKEATVSEVEDHTGNMEDEETSSRDQDHPEESEDDDEEPYSDDNSITESENSNPYDDDISDYEDGSEANEKEVARSRPTSERLKNQKQPSAMNKNSMVEFSLEEMKKYLTCSKCNGIFREPYTITECLHTFCKSCLFLNFYSGKTRCPTCNTSLGPDPCKAALSDRTLEEMIDKIFPELKKIDENNEREFYRSRGIELKDQHQSTINRSSNNDSDRNNNNLKSAPPKSTSAARNRDGKFDLNIADGMDLKLLSDVDGISSSKDTLENPLLRTSGRMKIGQLKKYLAGKLPMTLDSKSIEILCNGDPLGDELSLIFVKRTRWLQLEQDLCLHYRLVDDDSL